MRQNSSMPANGFDSFAFRILVQIFHDYYS
jgi:hypothetical protein